MEWILQFAVGIFITLICEVIVLYIARRVEDDKVRLRVLVGGTLLVGLIMVFLIIDSERMKVTNQPAPSHTPMPPALDHALMTPVGGIPPVALAFEAETVGSFKDEPFRKEAFGGRTVHLKADERIVFPVSLEQGDDYILYIRHSNDNLNSPKKTEILEVTVNGEKRGLYLTEDTGDGSQGWNIFKEPPFGDVLLKKGTNEIELVVTGGDGYGIEIDAIILAPR